MNYELYVHCLYYCVISLCRICVQFSIKGYNDKQHILLQKLMDKMMMLEIDEKRFAILLERVSRTCFISVKLR